jgi:hypothetical protein
MNRTPRTWRARGRLASILFGLVLAIPAGAAPGPEPAPLTVSIGAGVDADAVRGRLAAELRAPVVARADGAVCDLPCLSITIDDGSATVSLRRGGARRARGPSASAAIRRSGRS